LKAARIARAELPQAFGRGGDGEKGRRSPDQRPNGLYPTLYEEAT